MQEKKTSVLVSLKGVPGVSMREVVLESDDTRAGFSKEEQGVDLQMVKTFILRPEGHRAAPTGFGLALRSPNLMEEGSAFEGSQC